MVAGGQNHITDSIFHSITGLSLGLSLCNLTDYLWVYWCKCNCAGLTDSFDAFLKMLEYLPFTTTLVCSSFGG